MGRRLIGSSNRHGVCMGIIALFMQSKSKCTAVTASMKKTSRPLQPKRGPTHSLPPPATGAPVAVVAWLALLPLAVGAGACRFTSTCSHLWSLLSYWSLPMHLDSTCGGRARVGRRKCVGKLGVGAGALKEAPTKPL